MPNRTRQALFGKVERTIAVLATALLVPVALAAAPLSASADGGIATSTSLSISGGDSYGDPMTLTAVVTSDGGTPTGSVTFSVDGGGTLASDVAVDPAGEATATVPATVTGLAGYHADFTGTGGFADSSGSALHVTANAGLVLKPEPSVLEISRSNPLKVTLTLSAHATRIDGTPVAGEPLTFSVLGKQPNLFDFGGGRVICTATTNADGFASCGGAGLGGAVVSLLAGGSYVTHFRGVGYDFSSAKAKVIVLGGP
ncbi:MAG: hypothetical protein JWP74_3656 [Marmoricola sp.]|nr:hypothetical protein [Marmoricola sp.]